MAKHNVYSFYAELKYYEPKIWRRFEINGEKTVAELGYALMLMFEMQASHLFCFRDNRRDAVLAELRSHFPKDKVKELWEDYSQSELTKNYRYELPNVDMYLDDDEELIEANKIKLDRITYRPGWNLVFEYDYGDGWEVALTLERCEKQEISLTELPRVTEGAGFGIIEDIGGVGGLESLAEAFKKGKGKEYDEYCEWLGTTTLDLEAFDIEEMNFRLKKLVRVYKEIYEYGYAPTERSYKLLNREYQVKGSREY